ncbi:hypothetical protein [Lacrimispora sp. 210928-DFI.3.58]|uniref:hypothetical protein n=1 Tax=Lacrimispora sp. 210928-DFI.3.58 TaxID=2883214 RepID=UPI001D087B98|nr:hypothetical protein [Lacrimispora sp. 210928-DFI.3.58]
MLFKTVLCSIENYVFLYYILYYSGEDFARGWGTICEIFLNGGDEGREELGRLRGNGGVLRGGFVEI